MLGVDVEEASIRKILAILHDGVGFLMLRMRHNLGPEDGVIRGRLLRDELLDGSTIDEFFLGHVDGFLSCGRGRDGPR